MGRGPALVQRTAGGWPRAGPRPSRFVRLAKFLAHGGVASRRRAELIIAKGRVTVGGEVVTDPARDVSEVDDVRVDGSPVGVETTEVWAVNKPAGVVSTAREPGERPAVVELVDSPRAALSRRAPGRRLHRAPAADQRRRPRQPAHASPLWSRQDLPGAPRQAAERPRSRAAPLRRRARGRPHRPGGRQPGQPPGNRDRPQGRAQPPGAADGRGDRQSGRRAATHPVRLARPRTPEQRWRPAPQRSGDRPPLGGHGGFAPARVDDRSNRRPARLPIRPADGSPPRSRCRRRSSSRSRQRSRSKALVSVEVRLSASSTKRCRPRGVHLMRPSPVDRLVAARDDPRLATNGRTIASRGS